MDFNIRMENPRYLSMHNKIEWYLFWVTILALGFFHMRVRSLTTSEFLVVHWWTYVLLGTQLLYNLPTNRIQNMAKRVLLNKIFEFINSFFEVSNPLSHHFLTHA